MEIEPKLEPIEFYAAVTMQGILANPTTCILLRDTSQEFVKRVASLAIAMGTELKERMENA